MPETVVFTTLPRSIDTKARELRVAVHVGPRLQPPGASGLLGDQQETSFLDWPAAVRSMTWKVELGTGESFDAALAAGVLDSAMWQALFPSSLLVRPFILPTFTGVVKSWPVQHVANPVLDNYLATVRGNPVINPDPTAIESRYIPMSLRKPKTGESVMKYHYDRLEQRRRGGITSRAIEPKASALQQNLLQAVTFHNRELDAELSGRSSTAGPSGGSGAGESGEASVPVAPETEFHLLVSYLHDRPLLLRPLGLVLDLVVTLPSGFSPPSAGETTIRAVPQWSRAAENPPPPRTRVLIGPRTLEAKPKGTTIASGRAVLTDPAYSFYDWDVDSAALRTFNFANTVADEKFGGRAGADREADGTLDSRPPALTTNGLVLAKLGRGVEVDSRLSGFEAFNRGLLDGSIELHAEDLLRGYRVDVLDLDGDKRWRSLMRREGSHTIRATGKAVPVDDEGILSLSVSQDESDANADVRVTEVMTQWTGWSLSVPRPHAEIGSDGTPVNHRTLADRDGAEANTAAHIARYPVEDALQAPRGSLTRLRYNHRYRFRLRTVDLAGDSAVPHTSSSTLHASGAVPYTRHDPVSPPQLLFREPPTEGESADVLVIRSDYNTAASSTVPSLRIVVPPKVAQQIVEHAGLLDTTNGLDPALYGDIAARDRASLATVPERLPRVRRGADPRVGQDTMYFSRSDLTVPYFPDPEISGAKFVDLPGGEVSPVPFYPTGEAFPNARTFELRVVEGSHAPTLEPPTLDRRYYRLTVALPKAATKRVGLSASVNETTPTSHGLFGALREAGATPEEMETLGTSAIAGILWALSPQRTIRLIHAVRRPLKAPRFNTPAIYQTHDRSAAHIRDLTFGMDRASTGSVALDFTWNEQVDGGPGKAIPSVALRSFSLSPNIGITDGEDQTAIAHNFDLGDTRHRVLTGRPTARSRFVEYFRERMTIALPADGSPVARISGINQGSVVVQQSAGGEVYEEGIHYVVDYAAGTIRRTKTSDGPDAKPDGIPASPIEVSYLAGDFHRTAAIARTLIMKSTARPAPPKFAYAVPAFEWSASRSGDVRTSVRSGNRLRVYLERPWFSSGEGEKLGIVFWPRPLRYSGARPANLEKLVSTRATDPLYGAEAAASEFGPASFPGATIVPGILDEVSANSAVAIATYPVAYDAVKGLWYADVRFGQEVYSSLVRLALVRYQEQSISDAYKISRVRLTEYLVVPPSRTVEVNHADNSPTCTVRVSGQGMTAVKGVDTPVRVVAAMQTKDGDIPDPDLGWRTITRNVGGLTIPVTYQLSPTVLNDGRVFWSSGEIEVPVGTDRIRIDEYERMRTDHDESEAAVVGNRIVFTDHVAIQRQVRF